jgi:Na+/proline symporter
VLSQEALGWDAMPTLMVIMAITLVYTAASGLWGVAATDFAQFFVGSAGSLILAIYALSSVGGIDGLLAGMTTRFGAEAAQRLQFVPSPGSDFFHIFIVFITLKWWGNPPGALNQRIMSTKDERHATFATLAFATVHFAINYWPMILTALVSLVAFPDLPVDKAEYGYAKLLVSVLPTGMLGLVMASAVAAFMSTIDTQVNMGASYMVNDIYRRFIHREGSKKHFVRVSQVCTVIMLALAIGISFVITSVKAGWYYLAMLTAGYGFVVVARWFWWRINAWAEMAALLGSGIGSLLANHVLPLSTFGTKFIFTASLSIAAWIVVALITPPDPLENLAKFCRAVKPYPAFWGPVQERFDDIEWSPHLSRNIGLWLLGTTAVFSVCFGLGGLLLHGVTSGAGTLCLAVVLMVILVRYWRP